MELEKRVALSLLYAKKAAKRGDLDSYKNYLLEAKFNGAPKKALAFMIKKYLPVVLEKKDLRSRAIDFNDIESWIEKKSRDLPNLYK